MLRIQDAGELAYGAAVTLTDYWDEKRIAQGTLVAGKLWKKYSTWTYLGIGGAATLMSAMGWMRRYETWEEHISHGFIYALPGFARQVMGSFGTASAAGRNGAVAEANRILAAQRAARQLAAGQPTARTYEPQFDRVGTV